jgi:hypothetical protein
MPAGVEQLSNDADVDPVDVLARDPQDQLAHLLIDRRPATGREVRPAMPPPHDRQLGRNTSLCTPRGFVARLSLCTPRAAVGDIEPKPSRVLNSVAFIPQTSP